MSFRTHADLRYSSLFPYSWSPLEYEFDCVKVEVNMCLKKHVLSYFLGRKWDL